MSENSKPTRLGLQSWFTAWKKSTEDVVSQISGQPWHFDPADTPAATADSDLLYTIVTAGPLQGELALRVPLPSGIRLAWMLLQGSNLAEPDPATSKDEAITNEEREALEELLRQIAGLAATALAPTSGELSFQVSNVGPPWYSTADAYASFRTTGSSTNNTSIEIRISPALASAIESHSAASSPPPDLHASGCRRLLDVGLAVKLRFGTRRMALRDVLALSSGQVVELEDTLDSPVDLLLDGRIIARGEVVVIDGNYGLRVTSVMDPPPASIPVA